MRKPILTAAVIVVALVTCTVVTAQTPELVQINTGSTAFAVNDDAGPLAPQSITQSTDPDTLVDGTSVACCSAICLENSWLRLFDLDDDHGLTGAFSVESIDWGIQEVAGGTGEVTVNVYCLDEGLPFLYQFMNLKDSVVVPLADEVLTFHNTIIGGSCDTYTEDMAVELHAEDCNLTGCISLFIGMNDLGQTAPTYIASASCSIIDPTDLAGIGFPDAHLVMKVNGPYCDPDDGGDDDGGDVPATTVVGAVLLLLVLMGSGAYFLRRRARD
jgi:hypothetical protein